MFDQSNAGVYVLGFLVSWGIIAIFSGIIRGIGRMFARAEPPPDPWQQVQQTLATELQYLPDGRTLRGEIKWVECDRPQPATDITVHNRNDPAHLASCKECRDGIKPRYSGVSHRPSN